MLIKGIGNLWSGTSEAVNGPKKAISGKKRLESSSKKGATLIDRSTTGDTNIIVDSKEDAVSVKTSIVNLQRSAKSQKLETLGGG